MHLTNNIKWINAHHILEAKIRLWFIFCWSSVHSTVTVVQYLLCSWRCVKRTSDLESLLFHACSLFTFTLMTCSQEYISERPTILLSIYNWRQRHQLKWRQTSGSSQIMSDHLSTGGTTGTPSHTSSDFLVLTCKSTWEPPADCTRNTVLTLQYTRQTQLSLLWAERNRNQ